MNRQQRRLNRQSRRQAKQDARTIRLCWVAQYLQALVSDGYDVNINEPSSYPVYKLVVEITPPRQGTEWEAPSARHDFQKGAL